MDSVKYRVTWKTFILPIIGLIAFFLYIYLFNVDIPTIITIAQSIDLSMYLLAILFIMLETLFFALAWRSLLSFLKVKLSAVKSFLYVWYGIFVDIIIPAESISGEISRVYLVNREQNGTSGKVVASLVTHRLMGMGINLGSLFVGLSVLLTERQVGGLLFNLALFLIAITAVFIAFISLLSVREKWTLKIIDAVIRLAGYVSRGRWKLAKIREDAVEAARMFHDSMKQFSHAPKTLSVSIAFSLLSWFFSLCVAYLVFLSLGHPISWSAIIVTTSIVVAVKSIPLGVPFEVGLPEITMSTLYILLGVPAIISATATILNRILTLWLRFFIGFTVQQSLEIKAITTTDVNVQAGKT